jgi:hypothetical protein
MLYKFRETATIYTTVEANSEEEAWELLDRVEFTIPANVDIDTHECEINEIFEENANA